MSPNNIYNSEKLHDRFWSRSASIDCGTVACVLQKPTPTVEILANSLTMHIKLKRFCNPGNMHIVQLL